MKTCRMGQLEIGRVPRVVGTVSSLAALRKAAASRARPYDILEVRLDLIGPSTRGWQALCRKAQRAGLPVLLTIRSAWEGGGWEGRDRERAAIYEKALPYVSAVDLEMASQELWPIARKARKAGKTVIASFHDFRGTCPAAKLRGIARHARDMRAHVVKIATYIRDPADAIELFGLLRETSDGPLCVIGMGPLGLHTRVSLACAGSALTYGFIDRSAAPGQLPCFALDGLLRLMCPAFRAARAGRRRS